MARIRTDIFCGLGLGAILLTAGCATQPTQVQATGPAPQWNPEAMAILANNALYGDQFTVQLGASDRFGQRLHEHYVAIVQHRHAEGMTIAEVLEFSDDSR